MKFRLFKWKKLNYKTGYCTFAVFNCSRLNGIQHVISYELLNLKIWNSLSWCLLWFT